MTVSMNERLRHADQQHAEGLLRLEHTMEHARGGLNALILINGGALVGLFTLIAPQRDLATKLWSSGLSFSAALFCTMVAWLFTTMSQDQFQLCCTARAWNAEYEAEGLGHREDEASPLKWGNRFMYTSYGFVVLSMIGFIIGSLCALSALA